MEVNLIKNTEDLMNVFASSTGLEPEKAQPIRYLWTDAFAVCNYLGLYQLTDQKSYLDTALKLVDQVHHTLGKHRRQDSRSGWISGLSDKNGELHPTIGGLRIGKQMDERKLNEPLNSRMEWEMDGQYYHYLTKWMHALNRVGIITEEPKYNLWAIELAKTAHHAFTYISNLDGRKRMYWKMSIDLSRPLVESMGQHDPLDGFITYEELQKTYKYFNRDKEDSNSTDIVPEIGDMKNICRGINWITDDPLGIGGLLSDSYRIIRLSLDNEIFGHKLLETVLDSAFIGLKSFTAENTLGYPADSRLAFRELGLSIGLKGMNKVLECLKENNLFAKTMLYQQFKPLNKYLAIGKSIEDFWMDEDNRINSTWKEHSDINIVMLATSLIPEGFLLI